METLADIADDYELKLSNVDFNTLTDDQKELYMLMHELMTKDEAFLHFLLASTSEYLEACGTGTLQDYIEMRIATSNLEIL